MKFCVTSSGMPLLIPTSMNPGAIAFTVMFWRANSRAETLVSAMMPALLDDDPPAVAQDRGGFLRDEECAGEIDANDPLEIVHRHFLDGAITDDAGIVHENVEAAMSVLYLLHHGLDLRRLRYVALNHQRLIQFIRHIHRIGLVLSLRIGNVIHHALPAVPLKRLDHLRADSARTARDQHDFAGEIQPIGHIEKKFNQETRKPRN